MNLFDSVPKEIIDEALTFLNEYDVEVLNNLIKWTPVAIIAGVVVYALHNNKDKELCNIIKDASSSIKDASPMNQTKVVLEAFNNALEKKKENK